MKVLDKSRPGIAAQALGIAAGALEYATNYAKERIAFGKPIGQHQGVGFMLADMKTEVEAARLLLYESARGATTARPTSRSGPRWPNSSAATSRCRSRPMRCRCSAASATRSEYPVERMMRDAKITQIYEGTQQIQRLVIARNGRTPLMRRALGVLAAVLLGGCIEPPAGQTVPAGAAAPIGPSSVRVGPAVQRALLGNGKIHPRRDRDSGEPLGRRSLQRTYPAPNTVNVRFELCRQPRQALLPVRLDANVRHRPRAPRLRGRDTTAAGWTAST